MRLEVEKTGKTFDKTEWKEHNKGCVQAVNSKEKLKPQF